MVNARVLEDVRRTDYLDADLFWEVALAVGFDMERAGKTIGYVRAEAWDSAVIGLIQTMLPGWAWKIGTCSVSDDAWLVPDFNCPVHGERLRAEFGYPDQVAAGSIWDGGIDIDRRPPGNTALALLEAFIIAWEKLNG